MRTTFFTAAVHGPHKPNFEGDKIAGLIVSGHRPGHWSVQALQRLAHRAGLELVAAHSVVMDTKGGAFEASRKNIIEAN
jgi:hypothetical protein